MLSLAGCRDPVRPARLAGDYSLRSVDGALPARVFEGNGVTEWVLAGALVLGPGDRAVFLVRDSTDSPLDPEPVSTDSIGGRYRVSGSRIFLDLAIPEKQVAYTDSGAVSGDTLRIETHYPVGRSGTISTRLFLYRPSPAIVLDGG